MSDWSIGNHCRAPLQHGQTECKQRGIDKSRRLGGSGRQAEHTFSELLAGATWTQESKDTSTDRNVVPLATRLTQHLQLLRCKVPCQQLRGIGLPVRFCTCPTLGQRNMNSVDSGEHRAA